jgi:glycosyltransferase involved in cell wall biosynthesis
MRRRLSIHHFGPDPACIGGIGSVMRVMQEHTMGGARVAVHPTWRPAAPLKSVPLAALAARRIPRMRATDVCHVHLAENGSFVREGAIVVLAALLGKTTVVTIHGADFLPFARRHPRLAATVLGRAGAITCLDRDVLELVRALAPRADVRLLPNPVAIDEHPTGAETTDEIVLFAGEIGLRKGADVLSKAWQLVSRARPDARCVMVGPINSIDIPEAERLELCDAVAAEEMIELLRSARVVALPSRSEGMPMILTEAMSAGRPFVSTPVGGIPALAVGGGGTLVPVEDHHQLADRLIELLADPALARRLGEQGRNFSRQTRGVPVIDARLEELYAAAAARS